MKNMKSREFTIKTDELEIVYDYSLTANLLEEYVLEELEIPQEYIKSLDIQEDAINVKLSSGRKYFNDDWYVNLQRVS
jgi:hypothetical protein